MRVLLACLVALACQKEEPPPPPSAKTPEVKPPEPTPPPSEPPAPEPMLVGGGRMEHCPTTVEGATVDIKDAAGGVEITVTAADPKATSEIRADAKHLVEVSKKDPSSVKHTGEGEGGGGLGKCAVVLKDTEIVAKDVEGGVKITVKPKDAARLDWLTKEVRERHAKAPAAKDAPSAVGTVGGGRMRNCPTTVEGAQVSVGDAKDSVEVTITAKDKQATDEIRADAKHLAKVSAKDPAVVKHTGEGEGGGSLGRCPVVLTDTTITAADVPGGVKLTLKPTKPEDLESLRTEVKKRNGAN
jgi:TusA-related sulfurtransferase